MLYMHFLLAYFFVEKYPNLYNVSTDIFQRHRLTHLALSFGLQRSLWAISFELSCTDLNRNNNGPLVSLLA